MPGRGAAPGRPALAELAELLGGEAAPVQFFRALAHAKIVDRQDVGAAEGEDEVHLHGPAPDPARGGETLDDLLVVEPRQLPRAWSDALEALQGDVLYRGDLLAREPDPAQALGRGREKVLGLGVILFGPEREKPPVDGARRLAGELLEDDR